MATPLDERTYGNPPYDESAAIEAARSASRRNTSLRMILGQMLARGGLQAGLAGLGSVPRGANFGTAFLAAAGGASKAQAALDQQRMLDEYRAQQLEFERRRVAVAEREKPVKPEKAPYGNAPWYMRPEYRDTPEGRAARAKAEHIAAGKAKGPPKPTAEENARKRKLTKEMADLVHADPDELPIIATDSTLEPETNRKAMQILKRMQAGGTPSQVDQGIWIPPKGYKVPYVPGTEPK